MQAIVLARRNLREYDQLVTVYTKEAGKQEALARGLKKSTSKNAAALLPFFLLDVEIVPGKDLAHITKVHIIESFSAIKNDLLKITMLSISFEMVHKMIRGEERDQHIFNGLVEWLRFLNQEEIVAPDMLDVFIVKMWAYLGFKIELDRCVVCSKKDVASIDIKNGGILCATCTNAKEKPDASIRKISVKEANLLKLLLVKKLDEVNTLVTKNQLGGLHDVLYTFILFHSHTTFPDWKKML